jgi:serine/threonine-protein kinase PpkA
MSDVTGKVLRGAALIALVLPAALLGACSQPAPPPPPQQAAPPPPPPPPPMPPVRG